MAEKKKHKSINSIALLFFIIIAATILTYLIPSGEFARLEIDGKMVVDPSSFNFIEGRRLGIFDIFLAVPSGMINAMNLVIGALLIGGGLECIQSSGAINVGISRVIKIVGTNKGNFILVFLYYVFALMGGFLGFIEGSIPFIPIAISIAIGLGYDAIVGVGIAMVGAILGFACGPTNPYTVGVSQEIAGLEIYSGIGLRIVMFVIIPIIGLVYILRYAQKVKLDKSKSLVAEVDVSDLAFDASTYESETFTLKHGLIILSLVGGISYYVYGAVNLGYSFSHLGAIFIMVGIFACVLSGMDINKSAETFIKGSSSMAGAALTMGIAYGVAWIFTEAKVLDTIVYFLSKPLTGLPIYITAIGTLLVIAFINLLIPSGSGKALIIMPIVLPIAQIVGMESQTAIVAYQFGDALTNLCTPLLGVLLLALGFGRVPFTKWQRFILPLVIILLAVAVLFLIIAISIGYR